MIRQLVILASVASCLTRSTTAEVVIYDYDKENIIKGQKTIFEMLLNHFDENKIETEVYKKGRDYDLEAEAVNFEPKYQVIVGEFLKHYKSGMLPRGQTYSIYSDHTKSETVALFKLFYNSPDIWTLVHLSIWASINLNEYQFYYILIAALYHRLDTQFIDIPPSYKYYPEFFFNSEVMKKVYDFKIRLNSIGEQLDDGYNHIISDNYTNWNIADNQDDEYKLTYFTEDVSLNAFYEKFTWRYPSWMNRQEYSHLPVAMFGELYYWGLTIYVNRYLFERLSNDLDNIEYLNWDGPIMTGYSPSMSHPNGLHFSQRKGRSMVPFWYNEHVQKIKEFESRIGQVVDTGFMVMEDGKYECIHGGEAISTIANLIQGNYESKNKNYYGSIDYLSRIILEFNPEPYNYQQLLPTALGVPAANMRDPAYYRFLSKIQTYFVRFQKHLGSYSPEELSFDGVEIRSVNIAEKNLFTYFEQADTLIDNFSHSNGKKMAKITIRQNRMNHKPFTFNISIESDKEVKASIRIFLGPKYDIRGNEISENWKNFYEFDYFTSELKQGENIIKRKSTDNPWYTNDYDGPETFEPVDGFFEKMILIQRRFGLPMRLLLPKGKPEGMLFQFFVYVSKFTVEENRKMEPLLGPRDSKTLGFPLDRPLSNYAMPNMKLFDVKIFHGLKSENL